MGDAWLVRRGRTTHRSPAQPLRASRRAALPSPVKVQIDGVVLAETRSPVLLFETGLPTRFYIDRTDVSFDHLLSSNTQSVCPYKGITSRYWSARVGHPPQ